MAQHTRSLLMIHGICQHVHLLGEEWASRPLSGRPLRFLSLFRTVGRVFCTSVWADRNRPQAAFYFAFGLTGESAETRRVCAFRRHEVRLFANTQAPPGRRFVSSSALLFQQLVRGKYS